MLETYSNTTIVNCTFIQNKATDNGGAIYCRRRSQLLINDSWNSGGSILVQHSLAIISGGAIHSDSSIIDTHNCKAEENFAGKNGKFAMLMSKSKLKTNYLKLFDIKRNSVVITESSSAELRHVHFDNGSYYCSISALMNSNINLRTIYSE